jgi:transcriptional regulator with XRE-family HTH domain
MDVKSNAIRLARQAAGLTQGELAKWARIDRSKLSLFENDLIQLTPAELQRVEAYFDLNAQSHPVTLAALAGDPEKLRELAEKAANLAKRSSEEHRSRKILRQQARISQQELSRLTGIPRSKLSPWEAGKRELTEAETDRVLDVLIERARRNPYFALEQDSRAAAALFKSNRELREKIDTLEKKHAAQVAAMQKEIAALREWYDAMEKAAIAHARVEEASERNVEEEKPEKGNRS